MRIRSCDDCGKVLPNDALFCGQCGKAQPTLAPPTARPANASHLASTMIAEGASDPLEATAAKGAPGPELLQKAKPSEGVVPAAHAVDASKTVVDPGPLGAPLPLAPPVSAPPETPHPPTPLVATKPSAPAIPAAPQAPAAASRAAMNRTVVGYAAAPAPAASAAASPHPSSSAADAQMQELASTLASRQNAEPPVPAARDFPSMAKTFVGSAPPPAPIAGSSTLQSRVTDANAPLLSPGSPGSPALRALSPAADPTENDSPVSSEAPRSQRISSAIVLVCAGLFVACLLALLLYFRARKPSITARAAVDNSGIEVLRVRCPGCPDGATVSIGSSSAKVVSEAAQLRLAEPLQLGTNRFSVSVAGRADGKTESSSISIVLPYRIRTDFSTARQSPPVLTLHIETIPDTTISILDSPVRLDANGHGSTTIDLSSDLLGQNASLALVERSIPYAVKVSSEPEEKGALTVRAKVPPLTLSTPLEGQLIGSESFVLAGQTLPGATLTIDGHPATVDPKGFFGVNVKAAALGDRALEIVASDEGFAARSLRVTVVRIPDSNESAKALDATAITYRDYAGKTDAIGKQVVVDGEVVESRIEAHRSILVISDKRDCAKGTKCLVRVLAGTEEAWRKGERAKAFGKVVGTTVREGVSIPDVHAILLVRAK